MHVATDPVDRERRRRQALARIPELFEPGTESERPALLSACHDGPGSCTVCLTDWITTIERAEVREVFLSPTARNGVCCFTQGLKRK
jgi:hypothetical protein